MGPFCFDFNSKPIDIGWHRIQGRRPATADQPLQTRARLFKGGREDDTGRASPNGRWSKLRWWKMMEDDGRWWKMMEDDGRWWKYANLQCFICFICFICQSCKNSHSFVGSSSWFTGQKESNRAMFEWHQADVWRYLDGMCQGLKAGVPVDALEYGKVAMVGRPGWSIADPR